MLPQCTSSRIVSFVLWNHVLKTSSQRWNFRVRLSGCGCPWWCFRRVFLTFHTSTRCQECEAVAPWGCLRAAPHCTGEGSAWIFAGHLLTRRKSFEGTELTFHVLNVFFSTYLPMIIGVQFLRAYSLLVTINPSGLRVRWGPSHFFTFNLV